MFILSVKKEPDYLPYQPRIKTTILVMFPVSNSSIECYNSMYRKEPDHFCFQPQLGYTHLNGGNSKWLHHDKGLVGTIGPTQEFSLIDLHGANGKSYTCYKIGDKNMLRFNCGLGFQIEAVNLGLFLCQFPRGKSSVRAGNI